MPHWAVLVSSVCAVGTYADFGTTIFPINAQSPDTLRFYAFSVLSYIIRPNVVLPFMFNPTSGEAM